MMYCKIHNTEGPCDECRRQREAEHQRSVYQVVCEHLRRGEYIVGTYDNAEAALAHAAYSDKRINYYSNIAPAKVRRIVVASEFRVPKPDHASPSEEEK